MLNEDEQAKQLMSLPKVKAALQDPNCRINIAGYSLDNFKTLNLDGYTILCRLEEASGGVDYFPKSARIVLNSDQHSLLAYNFENLATNIATDLGVSEQNAIDKSLAFFEQKTVTVQPKGVQGAVYKIMHNLQNIIPMTSTSEAVSLLKTSGITGGSIIVKAPLIFVGSTYIGALFFGYCGCVAGNNPVGTILNGTSFVLSRPMRGVEIVLNGLILRPVSNAIGLPLILNGTQEILSGKGITVNEYTKIGLAFDRIANSRVVNKIRKIVKIIRQKD